ncbi:calcium-binding protein [Aureimonas ureilytica]|uniref:calcium-binding protein n=1 Tax=Aureimonas ureilytica TaxID=401562 RepID=UPI000733F3E8|nr:calcium-binding protein [Aureimonas ureilytica]
MASINMKTNGGDGRGTVDNDVIYGTEGNDIIFGNYGDDVLFGEGGDDFFTLTHANGTDFYDGGSGYDVISVNHSSTAHFVNYSEIGIALLKDIEEIRSDGVRPTYLRIENTVDLSNTKLVNILEIRGSSANNYIIGSAQDDKIFGYEGNDTLDGGLGSDTLTGGVGDDTYRINSAGDVIVEAANEGTDTVQSSISYTLGSNLEHLTLTGTSAINGTGNAGNNQLLGNSAANVLSGGDGNDVLNGLGGADTLIGGNGDDTYYVDNSNDIVTETAGAGIDTVGAYVGHALSANVENLQLLGTANINGIGNSGDNVIVGNSGNNTLGGNEGNDILQGGAGDDVLIGGPGNDWLQGDDGNDTLVGNDGVDRLFGGNGNDLLAGQGGNDELTGGAGADQFYFNLNGGQDTLTDFQNGIDKFVLGADIKNINLFTTSDGYAALEFYDSASSTPHTYVRLIGTPASQIDNSDFIFA